MRDKVTFVIATTISAFVLIALIGAFVLAVMNKDAGEVFPKIFDLVAVMVGAIGGYIAGATVEKAKLNVDVNKHPDPKPENDGETLA